VRELSKANIIFEASTWCGKNAVIFSSAQSIGILKIEIEMTVDELAKYISIIK